MLYCPGGGNMRTREDKSKYDQQYRRDHMSTKLIAFNRDKPEDIALLHYVESKGDRAFSPYIKELIRRDMEANEAGN